MDARCSNVEECAATHLEALNLRENYMTQESLRIVWLMLEVNENTVIEISRPGQFNWNYEEGDSLAAGALSELEGELTL
jgi:hypothetical protein